MTPADLDRAIRAAWEAAHRSHAARGMSNMAHEAACIALVRALEDHGVVLVPRTRSFDMAIGTYPRVSDKQWEATVEARPRPSWEGEPDQEAEASARRTAEHLDRAREWLAEPPGPPEGEPEDGMAAYHEEINRGIAELGDRVGQIEAVMPANLVERLEALENRVAERGKMLAGFDARIRNLEKAPRPRG